MRIVMDGALGDELGLTGLVREYKRRHPDEMIRLIGTIRPEIWRNNPYLNWGNEDDGRLFQANHFEQDYAAPRAVHYMRQAGLKPAEISEDLPELHFTAEELAAPLTSTLWTADTPQRIREILPIELPPRPVAIDPGAGWWSRLWPEARFQELSIRLKAEGFSVIQIGSQGRAPLAGASVNLVKQLGIRQVAMLLAACDLFVGNDSGYFHMAAAVGAPHVTVYGVSRRAAAPYSNTVPVYAPTDCSTRCYLKCVRREPSEAGDSRWVKPPKSFCMDEISVESVLEACRRALEAPRLPRLKPAKTIPEIARELDLQGYRARKMALVEGEEVTR